MAPQTLLMLLDSPSPPLVLDLRGSVARGINPPVAGARAASIDRLDELLRDWPRDALVVTLCACPQDATAIDAAHRIMRRGYTNVMPLQGGYDALMRLTGGPSGKNACS
jgi:rhodanese-related sulfurtransferase